MAIICFFLFAAGLTGGISWGCMGISLPFEVAGPMDFAGKVMDLEAGDSPGDWTASAKVRRTVRGSAEEMAAEEETYKFLEGFWKV